MLLEVCNTKVVLNNEIATGVWGFEYDYNITSHNGHITLHVYAECDKELETTYDEIRIQIRDEEGKGYDILGYEATLVKVGGQGSVDDVVLTDSYTYNCRGVGKAIV